MGKSLESDIVLCKKTFLMIHALKNNSSEMKNALELTQVNYKKGIFEIRNYLEEKGLKDAARNEINRNIELADRKLDGLPIDKKKLLYFSELIKKRGN